MKNYKEIMDAIKYSDDYTFISSKMGDVVVGHLVETILEVLENDRKAYLNEAGDACVALAKILSQKQLTDITDDEVSISKMYIEQKRKQDEINYIRSLQEQVKETEDRIINRVVKIIEEYEVKKEPLCEQNVLLKVIKERVIRN